MSHTVRICHSVIVLILIVAMAGVVGLAIHRAGNAHTGAGAGWDNPPNTPVAVSQ
jgi:hypothetical protein